MKIVVCTEIVRLILVKANSYKQWMWLGDCGTLWIMIN